MERVFTGGQMEENSPELMSITLCKAMVSSHGKMDVSTSVATPMIRNPVTVLLSGLMVENILEPGLMANKMEREITSTKKGMKEEVPGLMEKESIG